MQKNIFSNFKQKINQLETNAKFVEQKVLKDPNELKNLFKTFSYSWALLINIINFYILFSSLYWAGELGYPQGLALAMEILCEVIFMADIIIRTILKRKKQNKEQFYFITFLEFNTFQKTLYSVAMILSSFPQSHDDSHSDSHGETSSDNSTTTEKSGGHFRFLSGGGGTGNSEAYSNLYHKYGYIFLVKFFRLWDLIKFWTNTEEILAFTNYSKVKLFRFFKVFFFYIVIIHLGACAFLLIQTSNHQNHEQQIRSSIHKYLEALGFCVEAIANVSFYQIHIETIYEKIAAFIFMILGFVFFFKIYSNFTQMKVLSQDHNHNHQEMYNLTKRFCYIKKINKKIRKKIKNYYSEFIDGYQDYQAQKLLSQMPTSLQTEIGLLRNQQLIKQVKLFNLGSPNFILTMIQYLYPKVVLKNDFVVRKDEIAEEFFFIKQGRVAVLASDNKKLISILEEGAYFGEIGLLWLQKRSVSIKALTNCIFMCLSKEHFLNILQLFPDYKSHLIRVGRQRMRTTNPDEIPTVITPKEIFNDEEEEEDVNENEKINDEDKLLDQNNYLSQNQIDKMLPFFNNYATNNINKIAPVQNLSQQQQSLVQTNNINSQINITSHDLINNQIDIIDQNTEMQDDLEIPNTLINDWFKQGFTSLKDQLKLTDKYLIIPLTSIYEIWFLIITLTFLYDVFYIPFSLAFEYDYQDVGVIVDFVAMSIYVLDIVVKCKTIHKENNKKYITKQRELSLTYLNSTFIIDLLAVMPFDYFFEAFDIEKDIARIIRCLRLMKIYRIIEMKLEIKSNLEKINQYFRMITILIVYLISCHLSTCIMYSLVNYHHHHNNNSKESFGHVADEYIVSGQKPLMEQNIYNLYINFLYWSLQCATQISYGDIYAVDENEVVFQIITILYFRILYAYTLSEIYWLAQTNESNSQNNQTKFNITNTWVNHIKLSDPLKNRINKFLVLNWTKYQGIDDSEVMSWLPQSIQDDIYLQIMSNVTSKIMKEDEYQQRKLGVLISLIKKQNQVIIPKGEYVFKKGQLAVDMYWIIEGQVQILEIDESDYKQENIIALLKQGDFFGETSILNDIIITREFSCLAITDLHLSILNITDFKQLCSIYPEIKQIIEEMSNQRQNINNLNKFHKQETPFESDHKLNNFNISEQKQIQFAQNNPQTPKENSENYYVNRFQKKDYNITDIESNEPNNINQKNHIQPNQTNNQTNDTQILNNDNGITTSQKTKILKQSSLTSDDKQSKKKLLQIHENVESLLNLEQDNLMQKQKVPENQDIDNNLQLKKQTHQTEQEKKKLQKNNSQDQEKFNTQIKESSSQLVVEEIGENSNNNLNKANINKKLFQKNFNLINSDDQQNFSQLNQDNDDNYRENNINNNLTNEKQNDNDARDDANKELLQEAQAKMSNSAFFSDQENVDNYFQQENKSIRRHSEEIPSKNQTSKSKNKKQAGRKNNNFFVEKNQMDKNNFNQEANNFDDDKNNYDDNLQISNQIVFEMDKFQNENHDNYNTPNKQQSDHLLLNKQQQLDEQKQRDECQEDQYQEMKDNNGNDNDLQVNNSKNYQINNNINNSNNNSQLDLMNNIINQELLLNSKNDQDYNKLKIKSDFDQQLKQKQDEVSEEEPKKTSQQINLQEQNTQNLTNENFPDEDKQNKKQEIENVKLHQQNSSQQLAEKNNVNPMIVDKLIKNSSKTDDHNFNTQINQNIYNTNPNSYTINITTNEINTNNQLINKPQNNNVIVKHSNFYRFWQWFQKQLKVQFFDLKINSLTIFIVFFFNFIFIPVHLGFETASYDSSTGLVVIEIIFSIIILIFSVQELLRGQNFIERYFYKIHSEKGIQVKDINKFQQMKVFNYIFFVYHLILFIPLPLIFQISKVHGMRHEIYLVLLQMLRLTKFKAVYSIFIQDLKQYGSIYSASIKIINLSLSYFLYCHFVACIWSMIGKNGLHSEGSWILKIGKSSQILEEEHQNNHQYSDEDIYIASLYWAYMSITGVGIHITSSVNRVERVFSIFVLSVSFLSRIFIFGYLIQVIQQFKPIVQQNFNKNYNKVVEYFNQYNDSQSLNQINSFFNFLWGNNVGLDEDKELSQFPKQIKIDILKETYLPALEDCYLFYTEQKSTINYDIVDSIFNVMTIQIQLPDCFLMYPGNFYPDVYILLLGKAEIYAMDGKIKKKLRPGSFIGSFTGVVERQYYFVKNIKMCKFGKIEQKQFSNILQAYPALAQKLIKYNHNFKADLLKDLPFFQKQLQDQQNNHNNIQSQKQININNGKSPIQQMQNIPNNNNSDDYLEVTEQQIEEYNEIINEVINIDSEKEIYEEELQQQQQNQGDSRDKENLDENHSPDQRSQKQQGSLKLSSSTKIKKIFDINLINKIKKHIRPEGHSIQKSRVNVKKPSIMNLVEQITKQKSMQEKNQEQLNKKFTIIGPISDAKKIFEILVQKNNIILIHPKGSLYLLFELIHIFTVIYSFIAVPIYVAFDIYPYAYLIIFEVLTFFEYILYIFVQFRTPFYQNGILVKELKSIYEQKMKQIKTYSDLFAMIPLNLIFWLIQSSYKSSESVPDAAVIIFSLIRIFRLQSVFYLTQNFNQFELKMKQYQQLLQILKFIIGSFFVCHFLACFWFWFCYFFSDDDDLFNSWIVIHSLKGQKYDLVNQYFLSLFFISTQLTTTGFSFIDVINKNEKILQIILLNLTIFVIVITSQIIISVTRLFQKDQVKLYKMLDEVNSIFKNNPVPLPLKNRIECYFTFLLGSNFYHQNSMQEIKKLIPDTLYNSTIYKKQKQFIKSCQLFNDLDNQAILRQISLILKPVIYLTHDYILFKNDVASEMFFIASGKVFILSENEQKIEHTLTSGFFGEEAILSQNQKIKNSAVAGSLCEIFSLNKSDLMNLFTNFPSLLIKFKQIAQEKLEYLEKIEKLNVKNKNKFLELDNQDQEDEKEQEVLNSNKTQQQQKQSQLQDIKNNQLKNSDKMQGRGLDISNDSIDSVDINNKVKRDRQTNQDRKEQNIRQAYADNKFNIKKIAFIAKTQSEEEAELEENANESNNNNDDLDASLNEFIQEGEMDINNQVPKQSRRRFNPKKHERRLSRVSLGKELKLSLHSGLTLNWGMSLND